MNDITTRDRQDLLKVIRSRERVARAEVAEHAAEVRAEFERQLATIYSFDDEATWAEVARHAKMVALQAAATVAERCAELGIPRDLASTLECHWYGRGQNASEKRRIELRAVATSRIEAMQRTAAAAIARESVAAQEAVITGGLSSAAARALMATLPTAASLMPALVMESVIGEMHALRLSKRGGA